MLCLLLKEIIPLITIIPFSWKMTILDIYHQYTGIETCNNSLLPCFRLFAVLTPGVSRAVSVSLYVTSEFRIPITSLLMWRWSTCSYRSGLYIEVVFMPKWSLYGGGPHAEMHPNGLYAEVIQGDHYVEVVYV